MNVHFINWDNLVDDLLMISLRKPFTRAWIKCLMAPIKFLHADFIAFRKLCLYRINHNSQICYMEAVLNDSFDPNQRRIRIQNVLFKEPIYFYEPEENREVFFYEPEDGKPVYFREDYEFIGDGLDFVVMVPPDLRPANPDAETALLTRMKGEIDYYKLYSKNYAIIWVLANI